MTSHGMTSHDGLGGSPLLSKWFQNCLLAYKSTGTKYIVEELLNVFVDYFACCLVSGTWEKDAER